MVYNVISLYVILDQVQIDEDTLELILTNITKSTPISWRYSNMNTYAAKITRNCIQNSNIPSHIPISTIQSISIGNIRQLCVIRSSALKSNTDTIMWEPELLHQLSRTLFPRAIIGSTVVTNNTCSVPIVYKGLYGFKRAILMAKIKIFSQKRKLLVAKILEKKLNNLTSQQLLGLRRSILSIHGIIPIAYKTENIYIFFDNIYSNYCSCSCFSSCNLNFLWIFTK